MTFILDSGRIQGPELVLGEVFAETETCCETAQVVEASQGQLRGREDQD